MSLTLYFHPLSSFCMKVLTALYENDTPFTPQIVDLFDEAQGDEFKAIWPVGKFPVLRDAARDRIIPETSVIIVHLDRHYPGRTRLVPDDADIASQMHVYDRVFDNYVNQNMQRVVFDRRRPADKRDPYGVEHAKAHLRTTLDMIERDIAGRPSVAWIMGENFTMADCAAAPALFYADKVMPLNDGHPHVAAYLGRLMRRASFLRVLKEAKPYLDMFPKDDAA
ncbi:MAG: glutathione S-transferase family protein [Pseudorhodoplanes sp.]|uniref:glutathione S-transferase family protein n=1 Tax=Pseudorhodoplanes sp. TaxID=1934341 RepID=UPI003D134BF5